MDWYTNMAAHRYYFREPPLEPPDCWMEGPEGQAEPYEAEYDRAEDEMNGIFNRAKTTPSY